MIKSDMVATQIMTGLWKYENVFKDPFKVINDIESVLSGKDKRYFWKISAVGNGEYIKEYRDCVDFKISKDMKFNHLNKDGQDLMQNLYSECYDAQKAAVDHYSSIYNIDLGYWEASNLIKYMPGNNFKVHADDGYSYRAVVSVVSYLNDDYEGGELYFNNFGFAIKPKAGDVYVFPSTYLFSHAAMPVVSGTKYSMVTMLDYSDKFHKE
jgi:hypothetical protein